MDKETARFLIILKTLSAFLLVPTRTNERSASSIRLLFVVKFWSANSIRGGEKPRRESVRKKRSGHDKGFLMDGRAPRGRLIRRTSREGGSHSLLLVSPPFPLSLTSISWRLVRAVARRLSVAGFRPKKKHREFRGRRRQRRRQRRPSAPSHREAIVTGIPLPLDPPIDTSQPPFTLYFTPKRSCNREYTEPLRRSAEFLHDATCGSSPLFSGVSDMFF